jgi:hypothetical protein
LVKAACAARVPPQVSISAATANARILGLREVTMRSILDPKGLQ